MSFTSSPSTFINRPLKNRVYQRPAKHARQRPVFVLALVLGLLFTGVEAKADTFESLFMPGKVIQGHAKFEQKCDKCHLKMRKNDQTRLCKACHKKINTDLVKKKGFHGKSPLASDQPCRQCHSEHLGRGADIVHLDRDNFNHQWTNFRLKGAHVNLACGGCHRRDKKWRDTPTACIDCHKRDDIHHGKLGRECDTCHREDRWTQTGFDHDKTDFALKGAHRKVDCQSCHPNNRYEKTPRRCAVCHRGNDVHRGKLSLQCDKCHNERKWKQVSFRHHKDTEFPLRGKHGQIRCEACHKENAYKKKLPQRCYDCHRLDDQHNGRFGKKCHDCHTARSWTKKQFDHDKQTDFPLRGKHSKAVCRDCHGDTAKKEKLSTQCLACHRADDVHKGGQGKQCTRCHNEQSWRKKVVFDHDTTAFPLIGLHAVVACEECHTSGEFKQTDADCMACHRQDDTHTGGLGKQCQQCHNPNGWRVWLFDHDDTDFPLEGKHEGISCNACHDKPVQSSIHLPTQCVVCHQLDDVHRGNYGRQCARCHNSESFRKIKLR